MTSRCPCTSGLPLEACCGPVLAEHGAATTAEQLMRSRFTAFAVGDAAHLLRTWHPSTRPSTLELDDETRWLRLDVERTEPALVEFIAYYRRPEGRGRQHEVSRFVHEDERWFYLDGVSV
ncbi:YchJ family protein [Aeromicrobium sp. Leaf350]|uniref:YchJ family protein n=1 Tax=Aeromicrobium sp. Leaf350 TaxID=2876565 RepID=UPI001E50FAB1|nr:YchJ family protein [Aeromicrobium sp. Leaf350]